MPLYEYQCEACGRRFEVIQKFSETSETCRLCGKGPVHRQASAPGIQFKGSGWYITDYAQKGKSGESSAPGKSDKSEPPEKSDSKKSESTSGDSTASKGVSAGASPAGEPSKS